MKLSLGLCLLCWQTYLAVAQPPGGCGPPISIPYGIREPSSPTVWNYYCPAHWVFDTNYQRASDVITCVSSTWTPSTPGNCIPATCYPICQNGGSCMCGLMNCWCLCAGTYAGADCSVDLSLAPRSGELSLLYPLTDPHIIARPELGSDKPWAFDISANALHGEIYGFPQFSSVSAYPSGRSHSAMSFQHGNAPPTMRDYINVTHPSYDLSPLDMVTTGKYGFFMYGQLVQIDEDFLSWSYHSTAPPVTAYAIERDWVHMYAKKACCGDMEDEILNFQNTIPASFTPFGWYHEPATDTLNTFEPVGGVKTGTMGLSLFSPSSSGMFFGYSINTDWFPLKNYIEGNFSGLAIYGPTLTTSPMDQTTDLTDYTTFAAATFGSQPSHLAATPSNCPIPPLGGNAMPDSMPVNSGPGTTVYYTCPAGYVFDSGVDWRVTSTTCTAGGLWSTAQLPSCVVNNLGFCDPPCKYGGTCVCAAGQCSCNCPATYTGPDCTTRTADHSAFVAVNIQGIWPLGRDYFIPDGAGGVFAADVSGNDHHLHVGVGVSLADLNLPGYGSYPKQAYRFTSHRADSFMYSQASQDSVFQWAWDTGNINRIAMYHTFNTPNAPLVGQPVVSWNSPNGPPNQGPAFWLDEVSGKFDHIDHDGTSQELTSGILFNVAGNAKFAHFQYKWTGATSQASATSSVNWDNLASTAILQTSDGIQFGYSDYPTEVTSDLSMSAIIMLKDSSVGNMNDKLDAIAFSSLKIVCTFPVTLAIGYRDTDWVMVDDQVTYHCPSGHKFNAVNPTESLTCTTPPGTYTPSFPATLCLPTTTCYPTCANGAGCSGTTCSCTGSYFGTDCTKSDCNLPAAGLQGIWSMTILQLNSLGEEYHPLRDMLFAGTTLFKPGPFGPLVPDFLKTFANTGEVQVVGPPTSLPSFTVSAYVQFLVTSENGVNSPQEYFPLMAYTTITANPSPIIYLSPAGNAKLVYEAAGSPYDVVFNAGTSIGIGNWVFVTIVFTGSNIQMTIDATTQGTLTAVSPAPTFQLTGNLWVGTTDSGATHQSFGGQIACFSIYDSQLSLAEMGTLQTTCDEFLGSGTTTCFTCSPVCDNGGTCIAQDTCLCAAGYTDAICSTPVCSPVCQNGATCVAPNTCSCVAGWTDATCGTAICTPSCQNGATCVAPNTCSCAAGWTDATCGTPICTSACQNGATCVAPDTCSCVTGWTDATCGTAICTPSCQNGGACVAPNTCNCATGWTDAVCSTPTCSPTCQNGATCVAPDTCSCAAGWTDAACTTAICSPVCQNGGTCVTPNVCSCSAGWTDGVCSTAICSPTCQNGGTCVAPNTCSCTASWTDATCGTPICLPTCQNGGTCVSPNTCSCAVGWTDSICNTPICSPPCQNGATCSAPNTCSCPVGYNGTFCSNDICTGGGVIAESICIQSYLPTLLTYWPLTDVFEARDEATTGAIVDGTYIDQILFQTDTGPFGDAESSIKIVSPTGYIRFQSTLVDFGNATSWTVAAFVKATAANDSIFEWDIATGSGAFLRQNSLPDSLHLFSGTTGSSVDSCLLSGVWQFVAISYDSTTNIMKSFCNESYVGSTSPVGAITSNTLLFGKKDGGGTSNDYLFACGSAYTSALTTDELVYSKRLCPLYHSLPACPPNAANCRPDLGTATGVSYTCAIGWSGTNCGTDICGSGSSATKISCISALLPSLLTYWPLTRDFEAKGEASMSDIVDGIYVNSTLFDTAIGPFGHADASIKMASPGGYINFTSSSLNFTGSSWTLTVFVKAGVLDAPFYEWEQIGGGSYATSLSQYTGTNTLSIWAGTGNGGATYVTCPMSGVWQFVAMSYDVTTGLLSSFCNDTYMGSYTPTAVPVTDILLMGVSLMGPVADNVLFSCGSAFTSKLTQEELVYSKRLCPLYHDLACPPNCVTGTCRPHMANSSGIDCTCKTGWTGQDCATSICGVPPTIAQATVVAGGMLTWTNFTSGSWLRYACDLGYEFGNDLPEQTITCDGTGWVVSHSTCTHIPDQDVIEVLTQISDETLVEYAEVIGAAVDAAANVIAGNVNGTHIDNAMNAADVISGTLTRLANNAASLTPDQAKNVTREFSSAINKIMVALTEVLLPPIPIGIEDDPIAIATGCDKDDLSVPVIETPALTKQNKETLYNKFLQMVDAVNKLISTALGSGGDFLVNEDFFSFQILNVALQNVPSIVLDTRFTAVTLPSTIQLAGRALIVDGPTLMPTDIVTLVLYGYIDNVFDVEQPFNTPTMSFSIYALDKTKLKMNPDLTVKQVGKPLINKANFFAKQKVDVQCDISKVECKIGENADNLGASIIFPVYEKAGPFVLIFPAIAFNYDAYVAFKFKPSAVSSNWHINVVSTGDSAEANITSANNVTYALRSHFNATTGLRVIVPSAAIEEQFGNGNVKKVNLRVFAVKRLDGYDVNNLPPEACELQHVYGYHLKLASAKGESGIARKKRAAAIDEELELDPDSTEEAINFKSNYLGDIGADLVIPPNTIEFSEVFANFSTLVADNWAVLAFMVACIVFFLIGVVFAFIFDRDDINQWAYMPIVDNKRQQRYHYLVSVTHHGTKLFNNKGKLWMRLLGEVDDSQWRCLSDGIRQNYKINHPDNFIMDAYYSLGQLLKMQLYMTAGKGASDAFKQMSVFVDEIIILDAPGRKKFIFKVNKRITCDGEVHAFDLANEDDVKNWSYLIKKHVRTNVSEAHPWVSIMSRPLPSDWTRVERLACVVSGLFLAMLVNCMFYGKEGTSTSVGVEIAGIFKISWFTIWTSLMGALIIIPPTFAIGFIFKKVRRRSAVKNEKITIFNWENNMPQQLNLKDFRDASAKKTDKKKDKRPFMLPYGFVVVGWMLVAGAIGASAFFVVMYSLTWGREKSLEWLSGMCLHVVQDILLIQTVKVIIMAVVNSVLLLTPEDGANAGVELSTPKDNKTKKTLLFKQMRNVFAGIIHNLVYTVSFALVIGMTINTSGYQQIKAVRDLVTVPGVNETKGTVQLPQVFDWMTGFFMPNLLNGNQLSYSERYRTRRFYDIINHEIYLIGPIRLRQQRVTKVDCPVNVTVVPAFMLRYDNRDVLDMKVTKCQETFSAMFGKGRSSERSSFNGSWYNMISFDHSLLAGYNESEAILMYPWIYRETNGMTYAGLHAAYETGGYYIDLASRPLSKAIANITLLKSALWLDNATTVFLVELNIFNPQLNLFIPVKIVFEALPAGGFVYHTRLYPLQLYQYSGSSAMLTLAIQIFWFVLNISQTIRLIVRLKKRGKAFCKDGWDLFETATVVLSFGIMAIYAARFPAILSVIKEIKTDHESFVDLDLLVIWEDLIMSLLGVCFMMNLVLFFRHLTFNKQWAIFVGTFSKGRADIFSFLGIFVLLTLIWACWGHLMLGKFDINFSSVVRSILTLTSNLIGFNKTLLRDPDLTKMSIFYYTSYASVVYFISIQIFMAIVAQAYSVVSANVEKMTDWDADLADYLAKGFGRLLNFGKKPTKNKEDENNQKKSPSNKWTKTFDRLSKFAEKKAASVKHDHLDDLLVSIDDALNKTRQTRHPSGYQAHQAINDARKDVGNKLRRLSTYDI